MPGAGWRLPGPEPGSQAAAADGRRVWARERQDGCGLGGQSQGAVWDSCRGPGAWVGAPELLRARPGLQGGVGQRRPRPEPEAELRALSCWRSGTEPGLCPLTGAQFRHLAAPRPQPGPVSPPSGSIPEPCLPPELLPAAVNTTQGPSASHSGSRQRSLQCRQSVAPRARRAADRGAHTGAPAHCRFRPPLVGQAHGLLGVTPSRSSRPQRPPHRVTGVRPAKSRTQ